MNPVLRDRLLRALVWLLATFGVAISMALFAHYFTGLKTSDIAAIIVGVIIGREIGRHRRARRKRRSLATTQLGS